MSVEALVGLDLDDAAVEADVAVPVAVSSTVSETRGSVAQVLEAGAAVVQVDEHAPRPPTGTRWRRVSGAPSGFSVAITAGLRLAQQRLRARRGAAAWAWSAVRTSSAR